jgi:hypothetical protein
MPNKPINDTQDQAVWDAATEAHKSLCTMYDHIKEIKKRHELELREYDTRTKAMENRLIELCEGRMKVVADKETGELLLDLR